MKRNIVKSLIILLIIFFNIRIIKEDLITYEKETKEDLTVETDNKTSKYSQVLEIPKIKLKKGFYNLNSEYNKVKYGIEVIKENENLLILASHSGNSKISYFKNLDKLENGDEVIVSSKGNKEYYKIVYNYEILKNGTFKILKDGIEKKIILITCKKSDKTKQIVYVGESIKKT